jgi:hypothetical protein
VAAATPVTSVVSAPVSFVRVAPSPPAARSGGEESSAPLPTLRVEHEGVTVTLREDIGAATLATVVHALREGARRC